MPLWFSAFFQNLWHEMCCCSFLSVQRRQDLTSMLINSTNWFSDTYPVAYMIGLIIGLYVIKNTSIEMAETWIIILNCHTSSNSPICSHPFSIWGFSCFHPVIAVLNDCLYYISVCVISSRTSVWAPYTQKCWKN